MALPGATQRFLALDVFRGAAVALMILVNNPGSWDHLYAPLAHARWHGWTPTDLVFPFFLFAVGNALAFTLPAMHSAGRAAFAARVLRRTALIFAIGLLLNASPFWRWDAAGDLVPRSLEQLRVMGVLQRIALAWGTAALLIRALQLHRERALAWAIAALLLAYWAACVAFAQGPDAYSLEGFFGTALDRAVLGAGHLYQGEGVAFDPEGLASTLPAVAQVLLGVMAGRRVMRRPPDAALLKRLAGAALACLLMAALWQTAMPINKKLWTSSYVLLSTGWALALLAVLILVTELRGVRGPVLRFFEVFGKNALFVFVLSGFVPRVLALLRWPDSVAADGTLRFTSPLPWLHRSVFEPLAADPRLGSLLFACANLAVYWMLARLLDQRRIYLRV
jgi:predicted acyltransferase